MAKKQSSNPKKDFKDNFFVKPVKHFRKNDNLPSTSRGGSDFFLRPGEGNESPNRNMGKKLISKAASPSQTTNETASNSTKKPFDKKKYRLKKYSNKYKVQQWEEKRKKAVLHEYHREIKHDQPTTDVMKIYEEEQDSNDEDDPDGIPQRSETVPKPHESSSEAKKLTKEEEFLKQEAESKEAKWEARKAKMERSKKMALKTRRGQPVMKHRVLRLFKRIEDLVKE